NQFEKKHFGDADKYLIYQEESDKIVLSSEELNRFKLLDEEAEHGSRKKGKAIIEFLKGKNVNVLVSRQFGKNIKVINAHFIPVIISSETPDEVIQILTRHLHWIKDEWKHKKSNFNLFTIKAGILKTSVKK
ncbi:MAG: hypothetical protein K8S16_14075, partial [Bacteroidales bacterium]|nr:hypothetical protein [Bacteroidales bacterium]